jgi:hypothetical protein
MITMLASSTDLDLLGAAQPTGEESAAIASAALGRAVQVVTWSVERVPYEAGSPATGALLRVRGRTSDGARWSVFLKVLQHPRHWNRLMEVPPPFRTDFVNTFPWRAELAAWEPEFLAALPAGLRVPRLYRLVELPDDRVAVWMEDVAICADPWSVNRFERAAALLGGLAANRCGADLLAASPVPPGFGLRRFADGPVIGGVMALRDDSLWQHPLLATALARDVRAELLELAPRIPAILDMLDRCPQALPHGDASPQNLLVPCSESDTLVAIDIAFQCPLAFGYDLGQLLVGLAHAGELAPSALAVIHETLVPAFVDGTARAGRPVAADDVWRGYIGSLIVRSAFTSIPFDRLTDPAAETVISARLELTRFIIGLAAELPSD